MTHDPNQDRPIALPSLTLWNLIVIIGLGLAVWGMIGLGVLAVWSLAS